MVTQRPLPRSSWMVLLLTLVAAVLACHGVTASVTSHDGHGAGTHRPEAGAQLTSGIVSPPCHPTDDDQRADGDLLTCAAAGIGNGPSISGQPTGVLEHVDRAAASAGPDVPSSVDRGPPTLAELQLLRI